MISEIQSYLANEIWPPVPGGSGARVLAALFQMEKSQYLPPEELQEKQFVQINEVFRHSIRTIPYYKKILRAAGFRRSTEVTPDLWQQVPVLTRRLVQLHQQDLLSRRVPESHGALNEIQTSGSTGTPVKVFGTDLKQFHYQVCALRDHLWHRRDFSGKMAAIKTLKEGEAEYPGVSSPYWGPVTAGIINTGPAVFLTSSTDISLQAEFLLREEPDYLISYPSNLEALARYFIERGLHLERLRSARSLGETVGGRIRSACRDAWGVGIADTYSAKEVGYIALQCPENEGVYHVQSENVFVEVVDDDGMPCRPGEVGRVLLTALHNFAMPLLRYEIGDYAEVGKLCSCGRTLPVLSSIMGRRRNMLVLPDGRKIWPSLGRIYKETSHLVRQFQFVQKSLDRIEARLVNERQFTATEKAWFADILQESLRYPFAIDIIYLEEIPRSRGGKFEDFISEVA